MPVTVGGGDGRTASKLMCVLSALAAVLFLTAGVTAVPDEHKSVQEQPPEEV